MSDLAATHPRITPFLWFNNNAEEAVTFYLSVFPNGRRLDRLTTPTGDPEPKRSVTTIAFELDGQRFIALNGGPAFHFTEAVSFVVHCDSQAEIDRYWTQLTSGGGQESQCGWVKDRFGLSWQIVPANLAELLRDPRAMQAMLGMRKLSIPDLEAAAQG